MMQNNYVQSAPSAPGVANPNPPVANPNPYMNTQNMMTQGTPMPNQNPMENTQPQQPEYMIAHFNKPELDILDRIQGGAVINNDYGSPMKSYMGLSEQFSDPDFMKKAQLLGKYAGAFPASGGTPPGYAEGGVVEGYNSPNSMTVESLAGQGQGGDTEMAIIPTSVYHGLKALNGGVPPTTNPLTGEPQFMAAETATLLAALIIGGSSLAGGAFQRSHENDIHAQNVRFKQEEQKRLQAHKEESKVIDEQNRLNTIENNKKIWKLFGMDDQKASQPTRSYDITSNGPQIAPGSYASGGLIQGQGDGQSDHIRSRVPVNSYIIDASTVSDLGNGSTNAGGKVLDRLLGANTNAPQNFESPNSMSMPAQDVFLSDGEYEVNPEKLSRMGGGDTAQGAEIIQQLIKSVREQKRNGATALPPKLGMDRGVL